MRCVFFSTYTGLGGGETSLRSLLGALDRGRYEPILICPRPGALPDSLKGLGVNVETVPYRGASVWFVPALWARSSAVARIERALRRLSPGVVHSDFHTLPYALPACRRLGIPVVFTCYGWWFHPRPWQRDFYRRGPRTILAISAAVRRGFLGRPPFMAPDGVQVLHLGVDTELFRPRPELRETVRAELGLPPQATLVTMVARFQVVKGHDVFLKASRLVAERSPNVHFVVAGANVFGNSRDEAFRRRILDRVASDPLLRERFHFTGWLDRTERLFAASDVVVSSSRFESFGMSVVEGMSCGVPVVSTSVGGPSETMVDAETGYLVAPGQPDLIAAKTLALLGDEAQRRRIGLAGRKRVIERFGLRRYAEGFSAVLASVAGGQDAGSRPGT